MATVEAHPARGLLAQRRITVRRAAARIGVSEHFLSRCLLGHVRPSPKVRSGLAELLDADETELFRSEAFEAAARYPGDDTLGGSR